MEQQIKRVNFFDGQFLKQVEFLDEQYYHMHMRRRLNFILFDKSGVVEMGPESPDDLKFELVGPAANKTFKVKKGMAISRVNEEREGRELILHEDSDPVNLATLNPAAAAIVFVTIHWSETAVPVPVSEGDTPGNTRVLEKVLVRVHNGVPASPGPLGEHYIVLGSITFSNMNFDYTEFSPTVLGGRKIARIRSSILGAGVPPVFPVVTSFAPTSGAVGTTVVITGSRFTGATSVTFNGVAVAPADLTVNTDAQITVRVPAGATTGKVAVAIPAGTGTSTADFTVPVVVVKPAPVYLTGIPGTPGTQINPNGGNFNTVIDVYGRNFSVDSPATPTVQLVVGAVVAHTFAVVSITPQVSGAISYELMKIRVQAVPALRTGKIRVTTLGGSADTTENMTVFP